MGPRYWGTMEHPGIVAIGILVVKMRPLFAVCRTQYASICMWRGTWNEAEQELQAASAE